MGQMQMNYTVEDASAVKKILHIEIPQDDVAKEIDNAYKELNKTARVKGFRPGKVPRSVLERLYGKEVMADIKSRLIGDSCAEAIKESGLIPLLNPVVEPPELSPETAYSYKATIEIRPEIPDIDFKGLALKKTMYTPTSEEIDAQLKMLQKNFAELKPVMPARPAMEGDFVVLDYEGFQNDVPHPELPKTENMTMKIGSAILAKDFDDQITGMLPGETKEFTITFPEKYPKPALAAQEILFRVYLHEIREEILPELNDDFAKKTGDFKTMEDIKKTIHDNLVEGYTNRSEQEINEQIFSALIEKASFEVPGALIDWELASIIHEFERSFEHQQLTMESQKLNREMVAETYRDTAKKLAQRHLILEKIISQEKLTLPDEELDSAFRKMAIIYGKPIEEIKNHYRQNSQLLDSFKQALLEKHAIKLIVDNSVIEAVNPVLEYSENVQENVPEQ